ncbi:hypothetical protein QBC35DRAFT_452917 [Podospora australis]|uniref:gamma-glutamylcyclotransferase n=1 Tax=Podospora australis TaxID=1536484 RepID=A0AAN6WSV6_9PEZI|nr:hypothetical protein QBC35DRAFT_452917 [Podospora australis]
MARRCPESIFMGKATLHGFRWQINERGVANIVSSPANIVEGLVYRVNPQDERALDRSEGVAQGFYQQHTLPVTFKYHELSANVSPLSAPETQLQVLVYVSEHYTRDGQIREEYIGRMEKVMVDALALGLSQAFLQNVIAPKLNVHSAEKSAADLNAASPNDTVDFSALRDGNRLIQIVSGMRFPE